jgi:hypothetical protein
MAKKTLDDTGAAEGNLLPSAEIETATEAPSVVVFNGKWWETPDGRRFNTRLKAEKNLRS